MLTCPSPCARARALRVVEARRFAPKRTPAKPQQAREQPVRSALGPGSARLPSDVRRARRCASCRLRPRLAPPDAAALANLRGPSRHDLTLTQPCQPSSAAPSPLSSPRPRRPPPSPAPHLLSMAKVKKQKKPITAASAPSARPSSLPSNRSAAGTSSLATRTLSASLLPPARPAAACPSSSPRADAIELARPALQSAGSTSCSSAKPS